MAGWFALSLAGRVGFARENGFSLNVGEGLGDVRGTASAIVDESGLPLGVLSTISDQDSMPDDRLDRTGQLTKLYARSISHSLGYRETNAPSEQAWRTGSPRR